jgi:hypothetical protein
MIKVPAVVWHEFMHYICTRGRRMRFLMAHGTLDWMENTYNRHIHAYSVRYTNNHRHVHTHVLLYIRNNAHMCSGPGDTLDVEGHSSFTSEYTAGVRSIRTKRVRRVCMYTRIWMHNFMHDCVLTEYISHLAPLYVMLSEVSQV